MAKEHLPGEPNFLLLQGSEGAGLWETWSCEMFPGLQPPLASLLNGDTWIGGQTHTWDSTGPASQSWHCL